MMKGPKTILSETIANALADYFCISPENIQTKLLGEAGISLRDVQLQPLTNIAVGHNMLYANITGSVQQVQFEWNWGHEDKAEGGSDWIKNAHLTMAGLRFVVQLSLEDDDEKKTKKETPATQKKDNNSKRKENNSNNTNNKDTMMTYIQNQVKKVFDTLTISVTDFEFEFHVPAFNDNKKEYLVYGGSGVQLVSLGRSAETSWLTLDVTIANIFSHLKQQQQSSSSSSSAEDSTTVLPILSPISYKASLKKKESTIQIQGESNQGGIVLHLGAQQLHFMNALAGLFMASNNNNGTTTDNTDVAAAKNNEEEEVESSERRRSLVTEALEHAQEAAENNIMDEVVLLSTITLPLEEVALVLPNGTKLSLSGLLFRYHLDGSVFSVQGHDGIVLNDVHPLLGLNSLCYWQVDLVKSLCHIGQDYQHSPVISYEEEEVMALCHVRQEDLDSILQGVNQVQEIYTEMSTTTTTGGAIGSLVHNNSSTNTGTTTVTSTTSSSTTDTVKKKTGEPATTPTPPPWSISIRGGFGILFETTETIEVEVRNIQANMADDDMSLLIGAIQKVEYANRYHLSEPLLEPTMVSFDGRLVSLDMGRVVFTDTTSAAATTKNSSISPTNSSDDVGASSSSFDKLSIAESKSSESFNHTNVTPASSTATIPASTTTTADNAAAATGSSPPAALPFGIVATIAGIVLEKQSVGVTTGSKKKDLLVESHEVTTTTTKEAIINMKGIQIAVGPHPSDNDDENSQSLVRVCLVMDSVEHPMVQLNAPLCSAVVSLTDLTTTRTKVNDLFFKAKDISITAGYTVFDWKKLLRSPGAGYFDEEDNNNKKKKKEKEKEKKENNSTSIVIQLPKAHIEPLKIKAVVKGDLAGFKNHTFHIDAFHGTETTTSQDLVQFYARTIIAKSPSLITNADVLGFNVKDAAAVTAGTASKFLGGVNPFAGVAGLVAVDGVSNAIKAGKKGRGVEEDDQTQFVGDFFRGLGQAAADATAKGAAKRHRGKSSSSTTNNNNNVDIAPLDWAVGATDDVGSYANENKARLGGAGAGVGGFMVGFAVGGPVGGIIGGLAASKATEKTITAVSDHIESNQQKKRALILETTRKEEEDDDEHDDDAHNNNNNNVEVAYSVEDSTRERISKMTIVFQGYLWKRSSFVRADWKRYYFILEENGKLHYFSTTNTTADASETEEVVELEEQEEQNKYCKRIIKTVLLYQDDMSVGRDEAYDTNNDNCSPSSSSSSSLYVFTLNTSKQKSPLWILAAESDEMRDQWDAQITNTKCSINKKAE